MTDYTELVKALRYCAESGDFNCNKDCPMYPNYPRCLTKMDMDAAAAIEELRKVNRELRELYEDTVRKLPNRGEWIHGKELSRSYVGNLCVGIVYEDFRCSACGVAIEECEKPKWKFCPNCGAKMEVQE